MPSTAHRHALTPAKMLPVPRPHMLLALIRAVTLATFAATESGLPSRVLGAAALYVVGACVLGNLRPRWRRTDVVMMAAIVCADIAWCTAAFVYFGPEQSLPAVLYAALAGAVISGSSGWTAMAVGSSTAVVYAATMVALHRDSPLSGAALQLVIFQAVVIALAGTLSGCLAEQWRSLQRAKETADRLKRLSEASGRDVISSGDNHRVLSAATQSALTIFDAPHAWFMQCAGGEDAPLVLEACAGFEPPDRSHGIERDGRGIAAEVGATGRGRLVTPREHATAELSDLEAAASLGQIIAAPVPDEEGRGGVLLVTRDAEAAPFGPEDLAVLGLLGRRVSTRLHTARLIQDLHLSSSTDSLTGLLNHGVFLSKLAEHVQHARETGDELSLLVLDMDGFKQINDTAGHWEGNRVLRALAEALRRVCREEDVVARCGGDEFAVLLPGVGPEGAAAVAQRTAEALEEVAARPGLRVRVSASWGIASYPWDASTDEALFRRADDRLYEAKKAGGNHLACDPVVAGANDRGSYVRPMAATEEAALSPAR